MKCKLWDFNEKRFLTDTNVALISRDGAVFHKNFGTFKEAPHVDVVHCTGLVDHNKVLVHEGDILKHAYCTLIPWIVVRRSFGFAVCHPNRDEYYNVDDEWFFNAREVVGNIYENPELLKEQEAVW